MSRYADDEPDDYDMEGLRPHNAEQWHRDLDRMSRKRYGKESARRQKMFDRAEQHLKVILRLYGLSFSFVWHGGPSAAGINRSGQRSGLYVDVRGRLLCWDPRGGYRLEEYESLPF